MNDPRLSTTTKKLLSAAKGDMPTAAARAKVWAGVSATVGGAAAGSGLTAASLWGGGTTATKLLSMGALFGGTLTVGLAATLLYVRPASEPPARSPAAMSTPAPPGGGQAPDPIHPSVVPAPAMPAVIEPAPAALSGPTSAPASAAPPRGRTRSAKPVLHEDSLTREASLVTEARRALGRADPKQALRAVRAARAIPGHLLDAEELAVEEQALRALGRSDEANGIEVQLRLQYPDSDLAR